MNTYTHENHFGFRVNDGGYFVTFGRSARKPLSFREECVTTATLIGNKALEEKLPIYLYLSGGQDSEIMARAFLEAQVPFVALVIEYEDKKNIHDISRALRFCTNAGVSVRMVQFNVSDFIRNMLLNMAEKYVCPNVSVLSHTYMIETLEPHFPVIGGGDLQFERPRVAQLFWSDDLVRVESTKSLPPIRALKERGRSGATRFFSYTPEMMEAYLRHSFLHLIMRNEKSFPTLSVREWKSVVYHEQWDDLEPRQKYDGFERMPEAFPEKWAAARFVSPVDEEAARTVSITYRRVRSRMKECHFTLDQLLNIVSFNQPVSDNREQGT